jgi:hypothetical protein
MAQTIRAAGNWFKDEHGRTLHLRGVNLGGSSKVPTLPNGATHLRENFFDHRNVSFIGRPFPLNEADEHFKRLKAWGLTFLRLLVTWEAIEHTGPGSYDEAYLDYIRAIAQKAREHGFTLFIDPHQDVWSRFTGGDGAPGWTLDAVGLDMRHFRETGAAIVHQTHGDPFPRMIWPTNYTKLAAATMFTLFFAGNDFAPATKIDGIPAQEYLQAHYINAIKQVAARLCDLPNVIGYDTLNEPSRGYIGLPDLNHHNTQLMLGQMPTPLEGMLLGAGYTQDVTEYAMTVLGAQARGIHRINPHGQRAWLDGYNCVWQANGVWAVDDNGQPCLLRPHHFAMVRRRPINFLADYLRPFANRYASAIREVHPDALIFVEPDVLGDEEGLHWDTDDAQDIVYAPHWYDGLTLFSKQFRPWFGVNLATMRPILGSDAVRHSFVQQINHHKTEADAIPGGAPVVIGETGIPYDMNQRKAYKTRDYTSQIQAMDATMNALEANLVNFTLWNYTSDNSHMRGDLWNGEDLSIYSPEDRSDPTNINSGGRALEAVVRPYASAIAGTPVKMQYNVETGVFNFAFWHDNASTAPTEFFIPDYQYPTGYHVEVSDGMYEMDRANQRLIYRHTDKNIPHWVRVSPTPQRRVIADERPVLGILLVLGVLFVLWRLLRGRKK